MSVINIEEVILATKYVATLVNDTPGEGSSLIRSAGESFADLLENVPDKISAATALYTAGRMMAEVSVELKGTEADKTGRVIASYSMSLIYAAHKLLNK